MLLVVLFVIGGPVSLVGLLAALGAGAASGSGLAWVGYVGAIVLAALGLAVAGPTGEVDRNAGTLTVYESTHALADLTDVRAYRLGDVVLVRPRFVPQPGGRDAPWLVAMPAEVYERVEPALDDGVAADPDAADPASTTDSVVVALGGVCSLALAAGLALVAATSPRDGTAMVYWGASIPALVGVLLLALAARRR